MPRTKFQKFRWSWEFRDHISDLEIAIFTEIPVSLSAIANPPKILILFEKSMKRSEMGSSGGSKMVTNQSKREVLSSRSSEFTWFMFFGEKRYIINIVRYYLYSVNTYRFYHIDTWGYIEVMNSKFSWSKKSYF